MIILDLREKKETEKRQLLAENTNIPAFTYYEELMNFITKEKKNEEFLLICSSGNRAKMIYNKLPENDKKRCEYFIGSIQQFNILIKKNKGA